MNCRRRKHIAALGVLMAACSLVACASVENDLASDYDDTDLWDTSVVYLRHVNVSMLSAAGGRGLPELSGFISAIAARGDDLYFVDQGTGKLVHVSMASMMAEPLVMLQPGVRSGIYAALDRSVYVIDSYNRDVVRVDPMHGEISRTPLSHLISNPVDLTMQERTQTLLVLDGLDGRVVALVGGEVLQQVYEPRVFDTPSVLSATSLAAGASGVFLLDRGADQVAGFSVAGRPTGLYGGDQLQRVSSMTADDCGRLFIADEIDGSLFIGFADMSLSGHRVDLRELAGTQVADLWLDDSYLYVATLSDGIFVYLVDPGCAS